MYRVKLLMGIPAVGVLTLCAGVALAAPYGSTTSEGSQTPAVQAAPTREVHHTVRGEVTAVEPGANPPTLVVKAMRGKQELTVGVDITGKTVIRQGKAKKTLADIKVGDRVWMKYERTKETQLADEIQILKPAPMAATR
ncbi:MAG TPA: hypothetical protein VFV36_10520 [Candidatus Methylomirabilis sp.]|nr:hypothetical protein [Candidatus Methylomirabilis sp.]